METKNHQLYSQLITKGDLLEFRNHLIQEFKEILGYKTESISKEWLRSHEVRKILKISNGTLQTLRINGTLNYAQIGSIYYYKHEDILKMLNRKLSS